MNQPDHYPEMTVEERTVDNMHGVIKASLTVNGVAQTPTEERKINLTDIN